MPLKTLCKSVNPLSWNFKLWSRVTRKGRPNHVFSFGGGIGDDLLCTVPIREIVARKRSEVWILSDYPELFVGNPDVGLAIKKSERGVNRSLNTLGAGCRALNYTQHTEGKDTPPVRHIITEMCARAGLSGGIIRRPTFFLQKSEVEMGIYGRRQIAIQSSARSAKYPMRTKEWFPERFQAVVDAFKGDHTFVQIGSRSDPPLENTIDLRGKCTIRETAAVLSHSIVFVGLVGFLMHLARSVDCRAVIVYGGREHPEQSGYSCNENLVNQPRCSPCWAYQCDYGMECMTTIPAETVVEALARQLSKNLEPLSLDSDHLP